MMSDFKLSAKFTMIALNDYPQRGPGGIDADAAFSKLLPVTRILTEKFGEHAVGANIMTGQFAINDATREDVTAALTAGGVGPDAYSFVV